MDRRCHIRPFSLPPGPLVVLDPQNPSRVFALADHLYLSNDDGKSWNQLGVPGNFSITLAIDPQNPAILYAAGYAGGVSKSMDGGVTWVPNAAPNGPVFPFTSLAIDPKKPSTLYAASGLNVLKSTDAGASWTMTGSPAPAAAIAVDPLNSAVLYASIGSFFGNPNAPAGFLAKSTDAGDTWTRITDGLPSGWLASSFVTDPATPGRVYALGSFASGGLYRSDNAGGSWISIGSGLPDGGTGPFQPPWQVTALAVDPKNPSLLYAASAAGGLYRSISAGADWKLVPGLAIPMVQSIAINPSDPSRIYVGTQKHPEDVFVIKVVQ